MKDFVSSSERTGQGRIESKTELLIFSAFVLGMIYFLLLLTVDMV